MCFRLSKIKLALLVAAILLSLTYVNAFASTTVASGTCGDNLTWALDEIGTLIINGTGDMYDYSSERAPWHNNCTEIENVQIENGVTSIGVAAFYGCSSLASIDMPTTVISIGASAFNGCTSILNVEIPNSVLNIGNSAFYGCSKLENIKMSNNINTLGNNIFTRCSSLTNFEIPAGVTSIGEYAFSHCYNLENIVIPDTISTIDDGAFFNTSIENIYISDVAKWCMIDFPHFDSNPIGSKTNIYLNDELITKLTIPNGTTHINDYAFCEYQKLCDINIPSTVTSIGNRAFYKCNELTEIEIPSNVLSIGDSAFYSCSSLSDVIINEGVQEIAKNAFNSCTSLENITLPSSLTSDIVGTGGNMSGINKFLGGCSNLLSINVSESNPVYSSYEGVLYNKNKTTLIACPEAKTECTIPNGIINISQVAFAYCNNLSNIKVPDTVETIGAFAFYDCNNISDVYYFDSQDHWNNISVGIHNGIPESALIHYNSCYITYDYATNGGTSATLEFDIVYDGKEADLSPTATSSNQRFVGWNTDSKATEALTSYTPSENVTLYAIFDTPVTGVTLNKSAVSLEGGKTETLIAIVAPSNATDNSVSWASSDTSVATVSNGVVTAKSAGTAVITITATDGGYTANCTVTVTEKVIDENAPKITISDIKTLPGKEIQVTVDLSNNTGFASLGIEVGYNSDIMTLTKVLSNTGVGGTFTPAQSYTVNPFNMGWDSASNITYNGNLATLTFTVNEDVRLSNNHLKWFI